MKLPNDLVKSINYEKAKDREIHEFECVNGKFIQHYVLGGEHELTEQEIVDCLNALTTLDCDLSTAYAYITGQKEQIEDMKRQLMITNKALDMMSIENGQLGHCFSCKYALQDTCPKGYDCRFAPKDYFVEKAEKLLNKKEKNKNGL